MAAAYFIVLDIPNPGFDSFVNGKAVARDAEQLSKLAKSLGIRAPEDYFAMSTEEALAMGDEFDVDAELSSSPEQWFEVDEGLEWIQRIREAIESTPTALKNAKAVLSDLAEFAAVLQQAKGVGAKWHFSIDF